MIEKLNVPDGWQDVTIGQFQELSNIDLEHKDAVLNAISILIDKDPEEIRQYDEVSFNEIAKAIEWTQEMPQAANFRQVIEIDGQKYGLIKFASLSVGEWIDLDEYLKEPINNIHKIFALMYREVLGGTAENLTLAPYDVENAIERSEVFQKSMKIDNCYGALVFFSSIVEESTKTFQVYLVLVSKMRKIWKKQSQTRMKKWLMKESIKAGLGMDFSTNLQKETFLKSKQLLN